MDKNENIGRILKDRLKELNKTPSKNVWNTIELGLNKEKKKRKAILFFYRTSGIAIFALLFLIVFYNSKNKTTVNESFPIINHNNDSKSKFNDLNKDLNITTKKEDKKINSQSKVANQSIKKSTKTKKTHYKNDAIINKQQSSYFITKKTDKKIVELSESSTKKNQLATSTIQKKSNKTKNQELKSTTSKNINAVKNKKEGKQNKIDTLKPKPLRKRTQFQKPKVKKNKFQVSIYATTIFYNSLIKGSIINSSISSNSNISLGYGINASTHLSEKLWLRMGISNFELNYHTSTISYLEFPLALKYKLKHKKIGIEPIIGTSVLLLNNQTAVFNESVNLGILNNLNFFTLTGNISVLADYKIYKNMRIFIEPNLKMLFSAYNDDSNHKPFIFGVYTGLSYQF